MLRVCFIGASTVEGLGDNTGRGWPGRLIAMEKLPFDELKAFNLGIRGQTLKQIHRRANAECSVRLMQKNKSIIFIGTGANDLARFTSGEPRTPFPAVVATLDLMLKELSKIACVFLAGPAPVYEPNLPYIMNDGLTFDFKNHDIEEASIAYRKIADQNDVSFLDLHTELKNNKTYMGGLEAGDGLHTNDEGYQAVAKIAHDWKPWNDVISASKAEQ